MAGHTHRQLAVLRAAAAGHVEMTCSREPHLYVDGLACCDPTLGHQLAGLLAPEPAAPRGPGLRVPAVLTAAGQAALAPTAAA
ncbi:MULTISPECIES: hypothetical protein [Amycolatopsis]|uniref:Uncharacterized protein n=1 Tax=Amycolatopsis albidoflavus TaxID=102226 RepID=A0ABW5I9C7_9PSEU